MKAKSLLPSLYPPGQRPLWVGDKREEFPLFGRRPIRASGPEGKEGLGEIFTTICLFNYGLLSNFNLEEWIYPVRNNAPLEFLTGFTE